MLTYLDYHGGFYKYTRYLVYSLSAISVNDSELRTMVLRKLALNYASAREPTRWTVTCECFL